MAYSRTIATVWLGCVLASGCPGPDKGDTDGSTGSTTQAGTQTTGVSEATTGDTTATDSPTTGAGMSASSAGEPMTACEQFNAADLEGLEKYCSCAVESGSYPDVDACIAAQSEEQSENDCMCQIEAEDPAHAPYVACLAQANAGYNVCVAPLACKEYQELGPLESECFSAFLDANQVCYKISAAAVLAFEACDDWGPPFICGSGEPVPNIYLCDGDNDCADMSDEAEELCQF